MSILVGFLGWFGFSVGTWPVWGVLLLTVALLVGTGLVLLISWILLNRAGRAGWQAQSETSQAKAKALNDSLTASRLSHERSKAESVQSADLAKIKQETQRVIDGPQRDIAALKSSIEEFKKALGERDAALVTLRDERDLAIAQAEQLRAKIDLVKKARAQMLGDEDDHRQERQQLSAELAASRQQLAQAQAEIDRQHAIMAQLMTKMPASTPSLP